MAKKDRRTKRELLVALAETMAAGDAAQSRLGCQGETVTALEGRVASLDASLVSALDRVDQMNHQAYVAGVENSQFRRELAKLDQTLDDVSQRLYNEVDGRAREGVLLKALVATLANLPVHMAVDVVQAGAETAQVDSEVALVEFDKAFRSDVIEKAESEATSPLMSPSSLLEELMAIGGGKSPMTSDALSTLLGGRID